MPDITVHDVAAAAQVSPDTVRRWARLGLLPRPSVESLGKRGKRSSWDRGAPKLARRIKKLLNEGRTFEEVRDVLRAGELG